MNSGELKTRIEDAKAIIGCLVYTLAYCIAIGLASGIVVGIAVRAFQWVLGG